MESFYCPLEKESIDQPDCRKRKNICHEEITEIKVARGQTKSEDSSRFSNSKRYACVRKKRKLKRVENSSLQDVDETMLKLHLSTAFSEDENSEHEHVNIYNLADISEPNHAISNTLKPQYTSRDYEREGDLSLCCYRSIYSARHSNARSAQDIVQRNVSHYTTSEDLFTENRDDRDSR